MREKRKRKEKHFTAAQLDFLCKHALHRWKEDDSLLSMSSWMEYSGDRTTPTHRLNGAGAVMR
jgi:hypothetical protein